MFENVFRNGYRATYAKYQPRLIGIMCLDLDFCKTPKCTYTYVSLQFPAKMNNRGSKTPKTSIPFHRFR